MKKGLLIVLIMMIWGKLIGQVVPEYRIYTISIEKDCIEIDTSSVYTEESNYEVEKLKLDTIEYGFSVSLPKIISKDTSYFDFVNNSLGSKNLNDSTYSCDGEEFHINFDIKCSNKKLLSISIINYRTASAFGGNGFSTNIEPHTYDLVKKKELKDSDLVKKEFLEKYYRFVYDNYLAQKKVVINIIDGIEYFESSGKTKEEYFIEDFQPDIAQKLFAINKEEIIYYIYEDWGGAGTDKEFKIPLDKIRDLCNKDVLKMLEN